MRVGHYFKIWLFEPCMFSVEYRYSIIRGQTALCHHKRVEHAHYDCVMRNSILRFDWHMRRLICLYLYYMLLCGIYALNHTRVWLDEVLRV